MTRAQLRRPWVLTLSGVGWALVLLIYLPLMLLPVSNLAINPGAVAVTREGVALARTFPGDALGLPRPILSYREVVRPLTTGHNGGHPCIETGGPFRYSVAAPVGVWSMDWAAACTDDPLGFEWEAEWTWHVGALRLAPVRAQATFLAAY